MSEKKIVLIDGHSILTRAFFGVPDLSNASGLHTNAVYGFLNIMFKILEEEKPDSLMVAFDIKAPTFRHKMYQAYKGTRKPMPDELHEQVPMIQELLAAMNIKIVTLEGYEADDILGTAAKQAEQEGYSVVIVSGDRDLLQLATDKILVRIPKTKQGGTEIENYYAADVIEKYGVNPVEFIDMKGLMGDTSDNIPGVKSIGEKTAAKLIKEYQTIENIYNHIDSIKPDRTRNALINDKENAYLSKTLATININSPISLNLSECKLENIYNENSYQIIKKFGFKSFAGRFSSEVSEAAIHFDPMEKLVYIKNKSQFHHLKEELFSISKDTVIGYSDCFSNDSMVSVICLSFEDKVWIVESSTSDAFSQTGLPLAFQTALLNSGGNQAASNTGGTDRPDEDNITEADLKNLLPDLCAAGKKISLFDLKSILKHVKLELNTDMIIYDCMVCAYLLNPLNDSYDYDYVLNKCLGVQTEARNELLGKSSLAQMFFDDKKKFDKILATMALAASKSCPVLEKELEQCGMHKLYTQIEYPLIFVLDSMEKEGVLIDEQTLKQYGEKLSVSIHKIEKEIYDETGEEFNINSPKQLGVILFEKMKLPGGKKTKTGYSTSAEVLEKLAVNTPVVNKILEYRQLTKLKSTYADGLRNFVNYDGRIHGTFNQTITATGRISSTDPNLQNIPIRMEIGQKIREVFIPKQGCTFIDADYSQIELRILAHMSGDENLIEAYNSEQDIHKITASKVFQTPLDEVTPLMRRNAKAVNFGIVYGISSFGLSQDLSIGKKEAGEYIKQYFDTYPKVKEFLDTTVEQAKKDGYVTTLFGRRRPIPELKSSNFMQRAFGERAAMNSAVQGTAADIMKIAMIQVYKKLKEENLKSKLILQVHDEILIETAEEETEKVKEIILKEMTCAANLSVKLEVGLETGKNWLEAH